MAGDNERYSWRKRRSSRGERSARRLLERWREAPVRAATVGPRTKSTEGEEAGGFVEAEAGA